ncbi:MAG: DUF6088 family protein [Bacteroidia bacterium]
MIQSVDNKILYSLKCRQKNNIYFSDDFLSMSNSESIRKNLSVFVQIEILVR